MSIANSEKLYLLPHFFVDLLYHVADLEAEIIAIIFLICIFPYHNFPLGETCESDVPDHNQICLFNHSKCFYCFQFRTSIIMRTLLQHKMKM